MGMSMHSAARRGRGRRGGMIGDINVTPLVDVMLVLLIVFMVTAPLLTTGVKLDLPKTGAPELKVDAKPLTISVNAAGEVFLGEDPVSVDTIVAAVTAAAGDVGTEQRLYIRGDATADYGTIMEVMGDLSAAGFTRIGLITQQRQAK
jgi:biopolymer transport protein TolR